jgi:hypothetical protein
MRANPSGVRMAVVVFLGLILAGVRAPAEDDDDWGDPGFEELDGARKEEPATRPMMMGTHTLPAGHFGLRLSGGLLWLNAGAHLSVHDRVDVLADAFMPYRDFGNTWMVGGGAKVNIYQHGIFAYAFKLKLYGILYRDVTGAVDQLPEGLAIWPAFMIGMKIKEGCFYAEVGPLLYAYTGGGSSTDRVFQAFPMHFGGEIYVTDWFHVFINVDLIWSSHFGLFAMALTGPFNGLEGGVVFLF